MHSFAPLSNLKIFVKNCWIFCCFFPKFRKFCENFAEFSPNLTNFFRDFSKMQHFSKIFKMCNIFLGIFSKNCRFFRKKAGFSGHETAKKVIVWITYRASCSTPEPAREGRLAQVEVRAEQEELLVHVEDSHAVPARGPHAQLSRDPTNFRGLVLGCIEAKFCK